jgi:hypothetical protein
VALVRIGVSEEFIVCIIRLERIREIGKTLLVTADVVSSSRILSNLMDGGDMFLRNVGSNKT